MSIVKLRVPDRDEPLILTLATGTLLLVGREPNASRLPPALELKTRGVPIQTVRVPSMRVSANHLLIGHDGTTVTVCDLQSRNGTWLRLLPQHPISLPGDVDLTMELAGSLTGSFSWIDLRDAEWTAEPEYPTAVVKAIGTWLQRTGMQARVYTTKEVGADPDEESVPLADGSQLHVIPPLSATFEVPWRVVLDRVRNYVNEENVRFEQLQGHDEDFILVSPLMREVHRNIVDAAAYGMRLMILGPTGSGKERLARCFHKHSRQHRGPYATVNCALLKENLLFAQLFGAKKGSFTSATQDVIGVIEAAHEGTLFLDEVGEMDLEVQKALLRFLDSRGEYQRLGDSHSRRANVQIVCATNVALDNVEVRRGKFRDDLWYRLAVKVVHVPPINQRREDILAFLKMRSLRGGHLRVIEALTPGALQLVLSDTWPGNFRDLENFVERLPPVMQAGSLDESFCQTALREGRGNPPNASAASRSSGAHRALAIPASDWQEMSRTANAAFTEDHGDAPKSWGQLQVYMEKYLKPVFVAQSSSLAELNELSKNINYSDLARRLNIADGTTVKMHLARFIERFRRRNPEP